MTEKSRSLTSTGMLAVGGNFSCFCSPPLNQILISERFLRPHYFLAVVTCHVRIEIKSWLVKLGDEVKKSHIMQQCEGLICGAYRKGFLKWRISNI